MANRNWASSGKIYSMRAGPVLIDCNFIVDSSNENGLGIRDLKGPCVHAVYMQTSATPAAGNPNPQGISIPGGLPAGSPELGTSADFAILAYAAITGSTGAGSVVTGDMGLFPNTLAAITNFPPSVVIGTTFAADGTANQAMIDATAAYTDLSTRASTTIASELGGQTLNAGVYSFASGSAQISGGLTLTFNGSATDIFVIQTASTLTTGVGAGGQPVIAFTGGALAQNVYWAIGSSATINSAVSSAGAVFYGTVIAQASATVTQASTVEGRLFALTGAVTLSNTTLLTVFTIPPDILLGSCTIIVQLQDNYNQYHGHFKAIASPTSSSPSKIDDSALTAGVGYIISTVGDSTEAQWHALGLPPGVSPAVGVSFIASSIGAGSNSSSSRVVVSAGEGSNVVTIEMVGDANKSIAPDRSPSRDQGYGAQFILCCRNYEGQEDAPADGTLISLSFLLDNSGVRFQRE